jgi:hypothetical protein
MALEEQDASQDDPEGKDCLAREASGELRVPGDSAELVEVRSAGEAEARIVAYGFAPVLISL